MGSGRLGLPGLALNELFELVIRDSTEYSFVYRSWGREGLAVRGLRFLKTGCKPLQGAVKTNYAIQMSSYINRKLGYNGLNDFRIPYACVPPNGSLIHFIH